jgi:hypothetical protein
MDPAGGVMCHDAFLHRQDGTSSFVLPTLGSIEESVGADEG